MQLESDSEFQKIIAHSHQKPADSAPIKKVSNPKMEELEFQWKTGKIGYHEYSASKYALQRKDRGWHGYRRDFGSIDKKRTY